MLKTILKKLAWAQDKYPMLVILLVLTITAFMAYYAVRIETETNFDVMFLDDSDTIVLGDLVDTEFGGTDTLFVLTQINQDSNSQGRVQDIRHPDVIKALQTLKESLEEETFVVSAQGLPDLLMQIYGRLPDTLTESKSMINNLPGPLKEAYLSSVISDDLSYQNMIISVSIQDTPGYLERIEKSIGEKVDQTPFPIGVTAELTGRPVLMNRIMNYLIDDNVTTIFLAILGVFLVLWIYFKSWKISLFSVVPVVLTVVWLAGTMYLIDIPITVMIASVGAMIVGMSVDYAIHLTHRYHEVVREGKKEPMEDTVVGVGAALTASVMTTLVGFGAMVLGVTPMSKSQGTVLALGVLFAFILSLTILPPLMKVQRKYVYSKLDETIFTIKGHEEKKSSFIDTFLAKIAKWQVRKPWTVLGLAGIITVLIVPGFSFVYLDTDDENWMPEGDDVVSGMETVGDNFGGTESMNLLILADGAEDYDPDAIRDLRDPRVMLPMGSLDKAIEDLRWVNSVSSPTNTIRQYANNRVPQDVETIKDIVATYDDAQVNFNEDFSVARMTIWADIIDYPEYYELMEEVDAINFPHEITVIPQGQIPEDIELNLMLSQDTMRTAGMGLIFVIIIASLFYGSFISGLLAFIPILFAILWTVGTMGYIQLPFTVLTTGMLSILMGMGIDFSIHLIHGINENLEKKQKLENAVPNAVTSSGKAIAITTITTVLGFLVLSFATLMNTKRLGWTLAVGILATFFSAILIVPSVLTIKYRRSKKNEK